MTKDLIEPLRQIAASDPNRIALRSSTRRAATFGDMVTGILAAREELKGASVTPASRVATVLPNAPETAMAILSIANFATGVPLNAAYPRAELLRLLREGGVTEIVCGAEDAQTLGLAAELGVKACRLLPDAAGPTGAFHLSWADASPAPPTASGGLGEGRIALVLHTSGSTGSPKRVPLSVANLAAAAASLAKSIALTADDVCLNMMPMFHIGALVDLMLAPLSVGGAVAFADGISSDAFFAGVRMFEPTWFQAVPTVLRDILAHGADQADAAAVRRLRFVRAVSQPLPPKLQAEFEQRFGVKLVPIFGMTETAGLIASMPLDRSSPGSVGIASGTQLRIADAFGNELPPGRAGEVLVTGPNLMGGYEGTDAARASVFRGNWLRTGDEGYLDEDGFLYLTGRLKDVINRGGEKISPAEIDLILAEHPSIREAAAFPMPHPTLGEELAVAVVRKPATELHPNDVVEYLRPQIAEFKLPRLIVFLDALPRVPSGKLDRGALPGLAGAERRVTHRSAPSTPLARSIAGMWRKVLEVDDVAMEDNFFDLGGDSLRATTLAMMLEQRFERELPSAELFDEPTLARMEQVLARERRRGDPGHELDPAIYASLQRIMAGWQGKRLPGALIVGRNTLGSKRPFFWVPQSLHGFESLARCLDPERPLYAMTSLSLTSLKSPENTRQLGRYYAHEIFAIQPEGPYLVGGFCQGAVVAMEIAKALRGMGHEVALLALQDRFVTEPYDGEVAMFSGKRGVHCVFDLNHDPRLAWARYYSRPPSVFISEADHTELHNIPHVEAFARQLESEFEKVEAQLPRVEAAAAEPVQRIAPALISYRIEAKLPLFLRQGTQRLVKARVTNFGGTTWEATANSGIVVSSRWQVSDAAYPHALDGRVEIAGPVGPRETVEVEIPIRVPMRGLPMHINIEVREDGMPFADPIPAASYRRLVIPLPPRAGDFRRSGA